MIKFFKKNLSRLWIICGVLLGTPQITYFFDFSNPNLPLVLIFLGTHYQTLNVIGLIATFTTAFFTFYLPYKENKSKNIIRTALVKYPIWDLSALKLHYRLTFYKLQHALACNDASEMKGYVTNQFLISWQRQIDQLGLFDISSIDVLETRIVCCHDYTIDVNDRFVAYLYGKIRTLTSEIEESYFSQMLYFHRAEKNWLLDKVDNMVSVVDLLKEKSILQS